MSRPHSIYPLNSHPGSIWPLILFLCIATLSSATFAHEAWIQPTEFQIKKGKHLNAHIRVGKLFRGQSHVFNPDKTVLLEVGNSTTRQKIKGRLGDLPAIRHKVKDSGLQVIAYQSTGSRITYNTWEKFRKFAEKEGVAWILDEHLKRGYPQANFDESFFRYAKSLFVVDQADGGDIIFGLPFELIALTNPYLASPDKIEIQLLLAGVPHPNAQISVFHRADGDESTLRENIITDPQGKAQIPATPGHRYLLNAVHMEVLEKKKNAPLWRSHWASLTYEIIPR